MVKTNYIFDWNPKSQRRSIRLVSELQRHYRAFYTLHVYSVCVDVDILVYKSLIKMYKMKIV